MNALLAPLTGLALAPIAPAAQSDWTTATLPWLAALCALAAGATAFGVWALVARLRELERIASRFDALGEIQGAVQALARDRSDLDLRRIEHVLIELRDGQRRLEDAILRATQPPPAADEAQAEANELARRVIARVLAEGYERVQVVPTGAELEKLFAAGGPHEVLVEARRKGVLCKGRVRVQGGAVTDVELSPAYTMFP